MTATGHSRSPSAESARRELGVRLRQRCPELEVALRARVHDAVPDPLATSDAEYVAGMAVAVSEVLAAGLVAIERGEVGGEPMPPAMAAQARRAARIGVSIDTILRRYAAGHTLLGEYVLSEADSRLRAGVPPTLTVLRGWLDHLMASIAAEYRLELERVNRSGERRLLGRVIGLLDGSSTDITEMAYDFDGWHTGLIAQGGGGASLLRRLGLRLGLETLEVARTDETTWMWLGGGRPVAFADVERCVSPGALAGLSVAVGEPARGIAGWRLTHQQARAALPIAIQTPDRLLRYGADPLVASALQDETLRASLAQIYVDPLSADTDGGAAARATLRAYFAARGNVAAAAQGLMVDRHTVERRLRKVEERLDRPIHLCSPQLELALRLDALSDLRPSS